jgi:hypothetical protein
MKENRVAMKILLMNASVRAQQPEPSAPPIPGRLLSMIYVLRHSANDASMQTRKAPLTHSTDIGCP